MSLFENFPYTNFHELNLDWMIKNIKEWGEDVESFQEQLNTLNTRVDNLIIEAQHYILPSTFDDTDRASDIMNVLNEFGYCFLGPGPFVINSTINMPDKSSIMGMGSGTVLQLADNSVQDIAINVGTLCSVSNMRIIGRETGLPYSAYAQGTRKGIALLGDYVTTSEGTYSHNYAKLDNLTIENFNHSGIWAYRNDGAASFLANNIDIRSCHTGIDIEILSEYHSFTNVRCRWCNVACLMQGGNNLFSNCHFDTNLCGVKIDNPDDLLINPDHSSFVNCSICHTDNNTGYAIWINRSIFGMCFSNCQLWYGKIYLNRVAGWKFDNNIMAHMEINVNNSNTTSFINNLIRDTEPVITFNNCLNMIWENNVNEQGYLIINEINRGSDRNLNASVIRVADFDNLAFEALGYCRASGLWSVLIPLPGIFSMSSFYYDINRIVLVGRGVVPSESFSQLDIHIEPTYIRVDNIPFTGNAGELCIIDVRGNLKMYP